MPLLLCACGSKETDSTTNIPHAGETTPFTTLVSPARDIDILFMVDNSPSMDPKQEALTKALPKMMGILQSLPAGSADMHIGVISSDLGAGNGEGGCGSAVLGNRGVLWGNDPDVDPTTGNNTYATVKDIKNSAGNIGCGLNAGARWIEDVQNSNGAGRSKNYQGNLTDVLSCLTSAVGVGGCGYEHQLASLRLALNPMVGGDGQPAINPQNVGFLRRKSKLVIVLVTDEDDCSAEPNNDKNDGMFVPRTMGDSASLRCAARGHVCNDRDIPDYDPQTGYTGQGPFVTNFANCDAKDDMSSYRLPLIRIRDLIDGVNQAKDRPLDQISAYGIIGWPDNPAQAEYRIDKDDTAQPAEQQELWNYMPICKIPKVKSADGNIYKAYGGFRLKKFMDAFKGSDETNVFSVCHQDFSDAMTKIGKAIGGMLSPRLPCTSLALADADPDLPGIQPECQAKTALSCDSPGKGDCRTSGYIETPIAQCLDGQGHPLDLENPKTDTISANVRPCWYLHQDRGETGCGDDPKLMRAKILTADDQAVPAGTLLQMECMTCPEGQAGCEL